MSRMGFRIGGLISNATWLRSLAGALLKLINLILNIYWNFCFITRVVKVPVSVETVAV
jgi:hypothetical protein